MKGIRGLLQKSVLVDIFLSLVIIYLLYVALQNEEGQDSNFNKRPHHDNKIKLSRDVERHLTSFTDIRSKQCQRTEYFNDEKVTLISYFYNYQLYDLKMLLLTATDELVGQLIIVDDGSTIDEVTKEAESFFNSYPISVLLLRNENHRGIAGVLQKALKRSFYDAIVFIDTTVVCNRGWLPPLLQQLTTDPNSIAVPHFDKVTLHPIYYIPINENYVATLNWNLNTVFKIRKSNDKISPGLKPDLFAFRKSMLKSIGLIDWDFMLGGGEVAELAMRAWACGKSIKLVECSRVGAMGFERPFKITSGNNLKQFVGVWFDEKSYKPYASLQTSDTQRASIEERKKYIFEDLKCKSADWYFTSIAKKNIKIRRNAIKVGNLKVHSGSCAVAAEDSKVDLKGCEEFSEVNPQDAFQLTSDSQLISNEKCLTATNSAYVVMEDCRQGDLSQSWDYTPNYRIYNKAAKQCACHVTDPSKSQPNRQVVMVQPCEEKDMERFRMWTFGPL